MVIIVVIHTLVLLPYPCQHSASLHPSLRWEFLFENILLIMQEIYSSTAQGAVGQSDSVPDKIGIHARTCWSRYAFVDQNRAVNGVDERLG